MIRFGIVGAGGIATKFARDINYVKNATITAVAARSEKKAILYKKQYKVKYAFSSYEEMAKSDVIDAVYIATPHSFHKEHALLFLEHKKHVLVEKPIAVNEAQFNEMVNSAKENKVLLMEAMWTHFLPSTIFIRDMIKDHILGQLVKADIRFGYSLLVEYSKEKRLLNPVLAGGSLLDMGVYPVSFYNLIKQVPYTSLQANATFTKTGVDSTCNIEIVDQNKTVIHITSSIKKEFQNDAYLEFEKGTVHMKDFSRCKELFVNSNRYDIPYEGEGFVHEIRSFANSIEENLLENPVMTYEASRESMRLMDAVREKIQLKYPFE